LSGISEPRSGLRRTAAPIPIDCPRCAHAVLLESIQGDRCPGCHFEFTLFEPGQEQVAAVFFDILTGDKYVCEIPGGGKAVVHF
jgi:hypothetical protein